MLRNESRQGVGVEGDELSLEYVEVPVGVIIWGDGEVMDRDLDAQRRMYSGKIRGLTVEIWRRLIFKLLKEEKCSSFPSGHSRKVSQDGHL